MGMKKVLAIIVGVALLLMLGSYAVTLLANDYTRENRASQVQKPEAPTPDGMLALINAERAKIGIPALTIDENVQKSAQLKATDFAVRGYYSHKVLGTDKVLTPEMDDLLMASCVDSSENINGDVLSSSQAVDKWLASPPHKAAILDPKYSKTGFGVAQEEDGDYFTVQHFCVAK